MIVIDPAWAGKVQFYELLFGTWTVYILLVLLWERVLRAPLPEWKYVLLNFVGAGAFWINHYFQYAPLWVVMINLYTLAFLVVWWQLGIRGRGRSLAWRLGALLGAVAYTVAFILLENVSRAGVERLGVNEFWFMAASYFGFVGVILWRGGARQPGGG
jgi:hypothetical protein